MPEGTESVTRSKRRTLIKRGFRLFFICLTWIGLLCLIYASLPYGLFTWIGPPEPNDPSEYVSGTPILAMLIGGFLIAFCCSLTILIFGFISRHRYFWIGAISAGILYIIAFSGPIFRTYQTSGSWTAFWSDQFTIRLTLLIWIPGLLAIIAGILFKIFPKAEILKA